MCVCTSGLEVLQMHAAVLEPEWQITSDLVEQVPWDLEHHCMFMIESYESGHWLQRL